MMLPFISSLGSSRRRRWFPRCAGGEPCTARAMILRASFSASRLACSDVPPTRRPRAFTRPPPLHDLARASSVVSRRSARSGVLLADHSRRAASRSLSATSFFRSSGPCPEDFSAADLPLLRPISFSRSPGGRPGRVLAGGPTRARPSRLRALPSCPRYHPALAGSLSAAAFDSVARPCTRRRPAWFWLPCRRAANIVETRRRAESLLRAPRYGEQYRSHEYLRPRPDATVRSRRELRSFDAPAFVRVPASQPVGHPSKAHGVGLVAAGPGTARRDGSPARRRRDALDRGNGELRSWSPSSKYERLAVYSGVGSELRSARAAQGSNRVAGASWRVAAATAVSMKRAGCAPLHRLARHRDALPQELILSLTLRWPAACCVCAEPARPWVGRPGSGLPPRARTREPSRPLVRGGVPLIGGVRGGGGGGGGGGDQPCVGDVQLFPTSDDRAPLSSIPSRKFVPPADHQRRRRCAVRRQLPPAVFVVHTAPLRELPAACRTVASTRDSHCCEGSREVPRGRLTHAAAH